MNKYFLTTVAFGVWLIFFDTNSIPNRIRLRHKLNDLKQEKKFYQEEIRKDSTLTRQLLNDTSALEKFAREKYRMKKDNEDLFLIMDTTQDPRP
ncbi:MAG TPA: septum formation initiator family protein [Bacteroidales bacterium]|nr:septum formation initiator family protein [Bacteroidales bacterium]